MKFTRKNIIGFGIIAVFVTLALFAFESGAAKKEALVRVYPRDTLTGTTADTIEVPWTLSSQYQYNYRIFLKKNTGTPNTKVVLDERNAVGSSLWSPIDSFTCGGADSLKYQFVLRGTHVYGVQHRLRFVRTGSHSLRRDVILRVKPQQ